MKKVVRKPRLLNEHILDPRTSLSAAKEYVRRGLEKGVRCPCCEQFAKEYRRKLNSGMAYALVRLYAVGGLRWAYKPDVLRGVGAAARDESLLRFWSLLERGDEAGWWRVTKHGEEFVHDEIEVPKFAVIYNNELLRLEGPWIDIHYALGDRFSLDELMG